MTRSRSAVLLAALAFLWTYCGHAFAQQVDTPSTRIRHQVLPLNLTNNGQHWAATVGQQIEITLGTVGPRQYGSPQVSSPAIQLENSALALPPNPGGRTVVYVFDAAVEGEAQVKIPILDQGNPGSAEPPPFTVTLHVGSVPGNPPALLASMTLDQANNAPWSNGWTNLLNDVRQTFAPSLPRLTAVEVGLVAGNPGIADAEVTMYLQDAGNETLAVLSKTVPVADCGHALFVIPNGGVRVSPGQFYSIRLSGGSLFGWKYTVSGYRNGEALFNGKALLPGARSAFLFRTFGAE